MVCAFARPGTLALTAPTSPLVLTTAPLMDYAKAVCVCVRLAGLVRPVPSPYREFPPAARRIVMVTVSARTIFGATARLVTVVTAVLCLQIARTCARTTASVALVPVSVPRVTAALTARSPFTFHPTPRAELTVPPKVAAPVCVPVTEYAASESVSVPLASPALTVPCHFPAPRLVVKCVRVVVSALPAPASVLLVGEVRHVHSELPLSRPNALL